MKWLAFLFTAIIVSFYYFPFEFSFLPGINTKMGLAIVGIVICIYDFIQKRGTGVPDNILRTVFYAALVSVIGFTSVIINNTPDFAYATYIVSMLVWLSAAFTVCTLINKVHGSVTVEKVTAYITAVCVCQCIMALIIDSNIAVKSFVDAYVMQDQVLLTELERLYGIGASLDTAGVRFSACLILLMYVLNKKKADLDNAYITVALIAYIVIAVVGNMIARTTIVGVGLSLFYAVLTFKPTRVSGAFFRTARVVALVLALAIPLSLYLYDNSVQFRELSRFAFEGFFSLAETGEWQIDSNDKLKSMIIFPDNAKTWIIGDGYFTNPYYTDPFYVGYQPGGYYMGTDIGYCRFLFYFGIIGLLAFSFFFVVVAKECIKLLPSYKVLILFILLLGFVIWLKVATDVFLVFALLLCVGNMQNDTSASLEYQS